MSRKAPAVQVYAEDFLGGTRYMSNAEVGLYTRLLLDQVDKGSLPDDVEHFVKAWGKECRKLWPAVRAKFIAGPEPGTIVNARMAKAVADRDAFRLKQSEKGKLSAQARGLLVEPRKHHGSTVVEPLGDGEGVLPTQGKERASKILFANCKLNDPDAVKAALPELVSEGVNLEHYRKAILNWSDTKNELRTERGWLATFRQWTDKDREKKELKMAKPVWNPRA